MGWIQELACQQVLLHLQLLLLLGLVHSLHILDVFQDLVHVLDCQLLGLAHVIDMLDEAFQDILHYVDILITLVQRPHEPRSLLEGEHVRSEVPELAQNSFLIIWRIHLGIPVSEGTLKDANSLLLELLLVIESQEQVVALLLGSCKVQHVRDGDDEE